MTLPAARSNRSLNDHIYGWAVSAAVHTLAVGAAVALMSNLHQPPQPEPFRWDVSLVQPPAPQVAKPPQPDPTPAKPKRMERPVVETKPVIQPVQTVTHVVREEARHMTPVVRTTVQPVQQVITRAISSVNLTADTELATRQPVAAAEARQVIAEQAAVVQEKATVVREAVTPIAQPVAQEAPSPVVATTPSSVSRQVIQRGSVAAVHTAAVLEQAVEPRQPGMMERTPLPVQTAAVQTRKIASEPISASTAATPIQQASVRELPVQPLLPTKTAALAQQAVEPIQTSAIERAPVPVQAAVIQTPKIVSEPISAPTAAAPIQQASVREIPVQPLPPTKADYSWLTEALWNRVEQLKRYPYLARMNRWEGLVVLQAVIRHDGNLVDLKVAESSGHAVLDQDAMEVMRKACPLPLKYPLGKPQIVVQVPIRYKLQ